MMRFSTTYAGGLQLLNPMVLLRGPKQRSMPANVARSQQAEQI